MNKQELARRIVRDMGYEYQTVRNIIDGIAFEGWLHDPSQVPGWTITESEFDHVAGTFPAGGPRLDLRNALIRFGFAFVEDREPTNAEKWEKFIREANSALSEADVEDMAAHMDQFGVKAPGGE